MKKLLSFALMFALLLTLLGCQKVSLPYDLKGTVSVEVLAFNNDSSEPFAQFIAEGKEADAIVEMFSSLTLKELNYMEPSIRGYEFWFRDETGSDIAKIELPYGPSPLIVVGGTPYQDINSGVDIQYIGQLVDTVSTQALRSRLASRNSLTLIIEGGFRCEKDNSNILGIGLYHEPNRM